MSQSHPLESNSISPTIQVHPPSSNSSESSSSSSAVPIIQDNNNSKTSHPKKGLMNIHQIQINNNSNHSNEQHKPLNQSNWKSDTKNFRIQGWDPILIITQILAIQALHYLTLSLITPPLLKIFAKPLPLEYEGGPSNVAMIMDWREMVGLGTLHRSNLNRIGGWAGYGRLPNSLGRKPSRVGNRQPSIKIESGKGVQASGLLERVSAGLGDQWTQYLKDSAKQDIAADPNRGWVLSGAWFLSSMVGVLYLYHIVRRPIHIMDHSLTICLNHLILTTYYSSSFPTSIWFYLVLISSSVFQIVWTENLCVKREMRDGLGVGWKIDHRPEDHHSNQISTNSAVHHQHHQYENVQDVDR